MNCYVYSNKRYHLGIPIIENPNIEFDSAKLNDIKVKIIKKMESRCEFYESVIFSIKNSDSYFKFLYNRENMSIEKTKYKIIRLEELFVFIQEF